MINKISKNKWIIVILSSILIGGLLPWISYNKNTNAKHATTITTSSKLKNYNLAEIAQFDGSDPTKPIYLGYDGYVYDVTAGSEYYTTGGTYHYLAGKDSTSDLNMFGGEIIKKKYPIVGKIIN